MRGDDEQVPLGQVRVRWDELDHSHSVYDRIEAAPSDAALHLMWKILGSVTFLVTLMCSAVLLGILCHPPTRRKAFNLYILFLTIPDWIYSGMCIFTCWLSAAAGHFSSTEMCRFQSFYLVFGLSANAWINGIVAWEVYRLLTCSRIRQRYIPPKCREVVTRVIVVYLYCALVAALPLWGSSPSTSDPAMEDGLLPRVGLVSGIFCYPSTYSLASDLFYWLVYNPLSFGIPYLYVFWVFYDVVIRSKLLPPMGKRRHLSIFFFRISFVFLAMWMPAIVLMFMFRGRVSPWVIYAVGTWSHTQGFVSAAIACCKPDIYTAVKQLVLCRVCGTSSHNQASSGTSRSASGFFPRYFLRTTSSRKPSSTFRQQKGSKTSGLSPDVVEAKSSLEAAANDGDDDIPTQGPDFQFEGETPETTFSIVEDPMEGHPHHQALQQQEASGSHGDVDPEEASPKTDLEAST